MATRAEHRRRPGRSSSWITRARRLRIYDRDAFTCLYCNVPPPVEGLTLDHLLPRALGGSNKSCNLVTACHRCNFSRQTQTVRSFAIRVAAETSQDWRKIMKRIKNAQRRIL